MQTLYAAKSWIVGDSSAAARSRTVFLVTDAAGLLGGHCVKELLDRGYSVRGCVFCPPGDARNDFLRELPSAERLTLVEAPQSPDAWTKVVRGCHMVIHVATPGEGENEVVKGTEAFLQACIAESVKRVILTSSASAVACGLTPDPRLTAPGPDESSWTNLEELPAGSGPRCATAAERAAWRLVGSSKLEMQAVLPALLAGPLLSGSTHGAEPAEGLIRSLIHGEPSARAPAVWSLVDVRDCAKLHVLAAEEPKAGRRYLACGTPSGGVLTQDVGSVLAKKYEEFSVPTSTWPLWILQCIALFRPRVRDVLEQGQEKTFFHPVNGEELIGKWTPWESSVIDLADSMLKFGKVKKQQAELFLWIAVAVAVVGCGALVQALR
jgi:nucleoside-diphosphate-sugar epimerase